MPAPSSRRRKSSDVPVGDVVDHLIDDVTMGPGAVVMPIAIVHQNDDPPVRSPGLVDVDRFDPLAAIHRMVDQF